MCGIFGFTGTSQNVWTSVGGALEKLEYRGYDSWGIAWKQDGAILTQKAIGRIVGVTPIEAESMVAIGHTRWATHGGVTTENAHPHSDCTGRIALVHNGIIENMEVLAATLGKQHKILSQTDSEIIVHLLEEEVANGKSVFEAVRSVFPRLKGNNAIVVMDSQTNHMIVARHVSPILLGIGGGATFVASDAMAFHSHCEQMSVLMDNCIALCTPGTLSITSLASGIAIEAQMEPVPEPVGLWSTMTDTHFMDTEMSQQPEVLRNLVGPIDHSFTQMVESIREAEEIVFTGCGSALFAARLAVTYFGAIAKKRTTAVAASELEVMLPLLPKNTLIIALSQSGETIDVVDAIEAAQRKGFWTGALVNVMHSSLSRMVDHKVPLGAGQEQCVLATKSWFAKVGLLLKLAAGVSGDTRHFEDVLRAAQVVTDLLSSPELYLQIMSISNRLAASNSALVVGKGMGAATAQEIALKIKEASYVHAEAFAAGELKHGAIALVTEGIPCLIVGSHEDDTDMEMTAVELLSRGGYTIGIGTKPGMSFSECIEIPTTGFATPLAQVLIAQMLAYRTALAKGINPDRPRNLAKSVTVK